MSLNKESSRRHWLFGMLAAAGTAALASGCGAPAEDTTKFAPTIDTSQAAKGSDAPLATDKGDADVAPSKKKK